jgi:hypothetical protein
MRPSFGDFTRAEQERNQGCLQAASLFVVLHTQEYAHRHNVPEKEKDVELPSSDVSRKA